MKFTRTAILQPQGLLVAVYNPVLLFRSVFLLLFTVCILVVYSRVVVYSLCSCCLQSGVVVYRLCFCCCLQSACLYTRREFVCCCVFVCRIVLTCCWMTWCRSTRLCPTLPSSAIPIAWTSWTSHWSVWRPFSRREKLLRELGLVTVTSMAAFKPRGAIPFYNC